MRVHLDNFAPQFLEGWEPRAQGPVLLGGRESNCHPGGVSDRVRWLWREAALHRTDWH